MAPQRTKRGSTSVCEPRRQAGDPHRDKVLERLNMILAVARQRANDQTHHLSLRGPSIPKSPGNTRVNKHRPLAAFQGALTSVGGSPRRNWALGLWCCDNQQKRACFAVLMRRSALLAGRERHRHDARSADLATSPFHWFAGLHMEVGNPLHPDSNSDCHLESSQV
ncbi:MAG: hypothetical protein ACI9BK_000940 [Acidimicrobiales bacterium]|jgi:hypothetical protein